MRLWQQDAWTAQPRPGCESACQASRGDGTVQQLSSRPTANRELLCEVLSGPRAGCNKPDGSTTSLSMAHNVMGMRNSTAMLGCSDHVLVMNQSACPPCWYLRCGQQHTRTPAQPADPTSNRCLDGQTVAG